MQIIDLTNNYLRYRSGEIAEDDYFGKSRTFFDHYFQFWSSPKKVSLLDENTVIENRDRLLRSLGLASCLFTAQGFDMSRVGVLLAVGTNAANGHAFVHSYCFTAWFAIECFDTQIKAEVFSIHELVHALHYTNSPEFYFRSQSELTLFWRQLIVEGIATYASKLLLNIHDQTALWADALPQSVQEEWLMSCGREEGELKKYAKTNFYNSEYKHQLFSADDPNSVWEYRAGYYLGQKLIDELVALERLTLKELLSLPPNVIRTKIEKLLN
jgi:hypothetical protein